MSRQKRGGRCFLESNTVAIFSKTDAVHQVAIYCRVSTAHAAQEEGLEAQIERFEKMVALRYDWKLVEVYSDVASGKNTFNRMMRDCADGKVDLILSKSLSRFGRNTVKILENIYKLREHNVDAFFAVETMLENEKYIGNVLVGKTYSREFPDTRRRRNLGEKERWLCENAHAPIISRELFDQARQERGRRSNVVMVDGKPVRKGTHYSMKMSMGNDE